MPSDAEIEAATDALGKVTTMAKHYRREFARAALEAAEAVRERDDEAHRLLKRAHTILANMALENEGAWWPAARWPISHEPLRSDAKNVAPLIEAYLAGGNRE